MKLTLQAMAMPKRILIVEDEYITALDLKTQLILKGYSDFEIVDSGEEAIDAATKEKFDLILMDIKLRGYIDGIDAAKAISEFANIPVIYVSGNSDLLNSARLKETKPRGILRKPITAEKLAETLKKAFV